jgi:hydroxymethylpyrimidine pyrophosphatase-like HAD family hydrolase
LIQGTEANQRIVADLGPRWSEFVRMVESISPRGKSILTITAAGADKGVALAVACADMGIELEDVVAFGDADNDIEMFRVAGAAVVMGQAKGHVRDLATFVTDTCENDGVAVGVERLLERGILD